MVTTGDDPLAGPRAFDVRTVISYSVPRCKPAKQNSQSKRHISLQDQLNTILNFKQDFG